jgi:hypothetical protein
MSSAAVLIGRPPAVSGLHLSEQAVGVICLRLREASGSFVEAQVRTPALFVFLIATIWLVAHVDIGGPPQPHPALASPWRRTQTGWERADAWQAASATSRRLNTAAGVLPHPAIVALGEFLAASLFLAAGPSATLLSRVSRKT